MKINNALIPSFVRFCVTTRSTCQASYYESQDTACLGKTPGLRMLFSTRDQNYLILSNVINQNNIHTHICILQPLESILHAYPILH